MDAEKKVREFIREQSLIQKGDKLLLGLSGGADSVCLFYLLSGLRDEIGFSLRAVHVHHGIRAEADEDEAYVKALCEREQVLCYFYREDVPAYARGQGIGDEEAGRLLRYRDFEESLRLWQEEETRESCGKESAELSSDYKIATAHHENDQAETVLFRLFRGCGLSGLRGMLPRRGQIVRPLLCLSRAEIEAWLRERKIPWREDETNRTESYSRNKIRHRILAYAEQEINGQAAAHIAKTAQIVGEAESYIERQVKEAYGRAAQERAGLSGEGFVAFDIPALQKKDPFLQKQLLLYGLSQILAARKDIGAVHVGDILELMEKQGNGELSLPEGVRVRKCYGKLVFFQRQEGLSAFFMEGRGFLYGDVPPVIETEKIDLTDPKVLRERFGICEISEILHCIPQKTYTKWFDHDKIRMPFSVRHPESGDYLAIDAGMGRKSFRRYMIEDKVPASSRSMIWLLADGPHVMWVPGGRMSTYYKVTTATKTILQVRVCGGE